MNRLLSLQTIHLFYEEKYTMFLLLYSIEHLPTQITLRLLQFSNQLCAGNLILLTIEQK